MVTLEMVHLVAETCDKLEKDGQMIISYQACLRCFTPGVSPEDGAFFLLNNWMSGDLKLPLKQERF